MDYSGVSTGRRYEHFCQQDLLGTLAVTDTAFLEGMRRDYERIVGELLESLA